MKTAEEIASETLRTTHSFPIAPSGPDLRALMARAIEADRAQRFEVPMPLAGVIEASDGGVFRNERGDYLVEPIGDETGELILVRADGTTSTMRGDWETGWEA